jgi:hypothetical protein
MRSKNTELNKKGGISGHLDIRAKMNKDDWREMSLAHGQ